MKALFAFPLMLALLVATLIFPDRAQARDPFPVFAGTAAGVAVGVGLAEGWFVGTIPSSASLGVSGPGVAGVTGAIAGGLVAGIGTMVLIHSVTTPCHGFRIAIDNCRDGRLISDGGYSTHVKAQTRHRHQRQRRAVRVRG